MSLHSTKPQRIQTGNIVCIPIDVSLLKAILLNPSVGINNPPILQSLDGSITIPFTSRGHLYIQLLLPRLSNNQKCFQIDSGSSNMNGQIQFIYELANITPTSTSFSDYNVSLLSDKPLSSIDPCKSRRIKCKNGGQCQILSNGQTKCLCPSDNISGNDCENIGIRCADIICINQATCSHDNQSCICQLGNQGRDCSIKCGESYIQPNISSNRIVNGESAIKNSWPYIVYIQIGEYSWCGGSVIDSWNVLTAAHCTYGRNLNEFILWFGVHKLDERKNELNLGVVEKRSIIQIINHPDYKIYPIKSYENDLAILRLSQSVKESAYIRYLCILPPDYRIQDVQLHDPVEIIGWGYINKILSNGTFSRKTNELQQAMIRILPDYDCMEYRRDDYEILFQSKFMICAGTEDYKTDSCQGDSGGPLMIKHNDRWFAMGLVSFGSVECAKQYAAGVYTRLSFYSRWIHDTINIH